MDDEGFLGIKLLANNTEYQQSQESYLKSKFLPKFYQNSQNNCNIALSSLFILDNPEAKKSPVRYGQSIRIIQADSLQALTVGDTMCRDKNFKKAEFSDAQQYTYSQVWSICPQYQFRNDGEQVYEQDSIIIRSQDQRSLIINDKQIGASLNEQQSLKITIFKKLEDEQSQVISAQDLVLFYNIDTNSYLTCANDYQLNNNQQNQKIDETVESILQANENSK